MTELGKNRYQIIIIGGGASGFFAALAAKEVNPEASVCILERSPKLLGKVRISGGGRCNVTHDVPDVPHLLPNYPRGMKEMQGPFYQFSAQDTVQWFSQRGVELKTEADGRMFPITDNSETIIDCFLDEAERLGVQIFTNAPVEKIIPTDTGFKLMVEHDTFTANKLIIATGGFPMRRQYAFLDELGIEINNPVPSLFTFNIQDFVLTEMQGVSVQHAAVSIEGTKFSFAGPIIITHWGLSGPAVLRTSAFAARWLAENQYNFTVNVNWVNEKAQVAREELFELKAAYTIKQVQTQPAFGLPRRLWEYLVAKAGCNAIRWADISNAQIDKLVALLVADSYPVKGKTVFKEEFVTSGGVNLKQIDTKTMAHKTIDNLYFAGEIIDVDGVTGGFNFQAAWATGYVAGRAAVEGE
jgi:predicted Rossmann fold flavoprotein